MWKYLCKKRVTYLNILINIVFCKDIFHFISFSEAKAASSALSWSFFYTSLKTPIWGQDTSYGSQSPLFPPHINPFNPDTNKATEQCPKKMWTNMSKPSQFPNSHDWFIKKFHFVDEKITVHLQSEGGWHPSLPKPSEGRAPWTHPPMQRQSRGPHFLTPPGEKKTLGPCRASKKETDMVEILRISC